MGRFLGLPWLLVCASWGCGSKGGATAPNLADCTTCQSIGPGGTVHVNRDAAADPEAGDTQTDDAAPPVDAGTVTVTLAPIAAFSDATFSKDPKSYAGAVKVTSIDPSGGNVDTGADGVVLSQMLSGVTVGADWFAVQDTNPTVTIASTLQPVTVDDKTSTIQLTALYASQLAATNVDGMLLGGPASGEATVVLVFRKAGQGVAGISVTGTGIPQGNVAYYTGKTATPYQTQEGATNATGTDSTVLITHVPVAAQFPNLIPLTLTCSINQSTFNVAVDVAQAFVTFVPVEVP